MWNLKKFSKHVAVVDNYKDYYYKDLIKFCHEIKKKISKKKSLILILSENTIGSLAGYIAFIQLKKVPIVLNRETKSDDLKKIIKYYMPEYIWIPENKKNTYIYDNYIKVFKLLNFYLFKKKIFNKNIRIYPELCILTATSGSTGSPKFVRQSYANIKSNTESIIKYLKINKKSKTITTLPMNYTFGQSIINTHLYMGGKIVLCNTSILHLNFWQLFSKYEINFLYGVPYTFEILEKLKFFNKKNKFLKTIAQAGGKLSESIQKKIFDYCLKYNFFFYTMYGQAEATTRISYLSHSANYKKLGSIGKSISHGKIYLIDNNGKIIDFANKVGNLIYEGPNVCLGYSFNRKDLNKGDEWNGKLNTGDLAIKDKDSYFYIVGRKKRFAKIFGISVNLDDIENKLSKRYPLINFLVVSNDSKIFIYLDNKKIMTQTLNYLKKTYNLNSLIFKLRYIKNIPRFKSGKKNYMSILKNIKN